MSNIGKPIREWIVEEPKILPVEISPERKEGEEYKEEVKKEIERELEKVGV